MKIQERKKTGGGGLITRDMIFVLKNTLCMRIDCRRATVKGYYTFAQWFLRNNMEFFSAEVINVLDKMRLEKINFMFKEKIIHFL